MTESTQPEIPEKWYELLRQHNLADWTIVRGENYCWMESKKIAISPDADLIDFLHELAHVLHPFTEGPLNNHYHGGGWAQTFGKLCRVEYTACKQLIRDSLDILAKHYHPNEERSRDLTTAEAEIRRRAEELLR